MTPVIEADIGDGETRRLFLGVEELSRIKQECGRGFYSLYSQFHIDADPKEVRAVIRLALIGGGMEPTEANDLVSYYCRPPRPLKNAYLVAWEALDGCWNGVEPDKSSEKMTAEQMDAMFTEFKANIARGGLSVDLSGMSMADFIDLAKAMSADKDKPDAPDTEIFTAIKNSAKKG